MGGEKVMIVIVKKWMKVELGCNANTNTCIYANIVTIQPHKKYTESDRCTMPHQCIQIRK